MRGATLFVTGTVFVVLFAIAAWVTAIVVTVFAAILAAVRATVFAPILTTVLTAILATRRFVRLASYRGCGEQRAGHEYGSPQL